MGRSGEREIPLTQKVPVLPSQGTTVANLVMLT